MSWQWWTPEELADLAALRENGRTWPEIAVYLNRKYSTARTTDACRDRYKRLRANAALGLNKQLPPRLELRRESPSYDDVIVAWNEWMGRTVRDVKGPPRQEKERRRLGIICDTHCPHENRDVLARFVADGPYDIAVLAGDVLDFLAVSPFYRERHSSMKEEVQHGTWVFEILAGCASEVYVIGGNHGRRILKQLSKAKLPTDLLELLQWFEPQLDIFKLMASGLPNVHVVNNEVPTRDGSMLRVHFLIQLGDAVIGHPDFSRKVRMKAISGFREWLEEWKATLGLANWRVVAQGHTHQAGIVFPLGGAEAWIELGAAATVEAMQYALRGKLHWKPLVPCYTVLEQVKDEKFGWRTDFNSIRLVLV